MTKKDCVAEAKAASESKEDAKESFHLMKQHPTLCGQLMIFLNFLTHTDALRLISGSHMFTAAAHLYNACKKSGALEHPWTDMDALIELQGERHVFVGDAPKKPAQFSARLLLALGASIQAVASAGPRDRGQKRLWLTPENIRSLRETSCIYGVFLERSQRHRMCTTLDWPGSRMLRRVVAEDYVNSLPKGKGASKHRGMHWTDVDTIAVLELLADRMDAEEPGIAFNYLSFAQRCMRVLEAGWKTVAESVNAPLEFNTPSDRERIGLIPAEIFNVAKEFGFKPLKMASKGVAEIIEKEGDVEMKAARKLWKEES